MALRSASARSKLCLHQQHYQLLYLVAPWPYWTRIAPPVLFPLVLSLTAPPLPPHEQMCFEAYKGPQHWLNHLFRTHHLQDLVAMLTSFSDAAGAPGSALSLHAVRGTEVGRNGPPTPATGCSCLNTSLHPPHRCSCSLFPAAPQACDYSLMLALGNKDGVGWVLCLEAANTKRLATQMWDYGTETCSCMSGQKGKKNENKKHTQPDSGWAIMKGSRRLRDKMKEIKLTDRSDITFNPLLIFSVLQLSDSSGDDQISEEGSWLWSPPDYFWQQEQKALGDRRTWAEGRSSSRLH